MIPGIQRTRNPEPGTRTSELRHAGTPEPRNPGTPHLGRWLAPLLLSTSIEEELTVKYGIAWLLGVPGSIILLWFLANQAGCGF
jgi:hypothetical protein